MFSCKSDQITIIICQPNVTVCSPEEGNTIVLTCVAFGVPNPDISWTANGVTLSNDSRITVYSELVEEGGVMFVSSMLEICSVGVDDAGRYSCMASYGERNDTAMFNVSVTGVEGEKWTMSERTNCYYYNYYLVTESLELLFVVFRLL